MNIRNFCIIAHIDHGKSTLADRMLEITETVRKSDKTQVLDRMDLEQERGITIKLTPVRMQRKNYEFNLIDTPGHVDFQYEVSRSLAAVEGAILLVDASQGIQAQTLSTLYMAIEQNIEIIPILNKIDLPAANPERVAKEIEKILGISPDNIIKVSAKTGENVSQVLDTIIDRIPAPQRPTSNTNYNRALIFDSVYDSYKWVVSYIKVVEGKFKGGDEIYLIHTDNTIKPPELGHFAPDYSPDITLNQWQIGYIITWEKSVRDAQIWDTLISWYQTKQQDQLIDYAIPWFKKAKPFIYAGIYPIENNDYDKLKKSLEKLALNDSALEYTMEDSKALGLGFRCGFLWMLHMDIIKERLSREYDIETIFTTPTVIYLVKSKNLSIPPIKSQKNIKELRKSGLDQYIPEDISSRVMIKSWWEMIDQWDIEKILEPMAEVEVVGPQDYAWPIMELCQEYRWELKNMEYLDATRVVRTYKMPFGEIIVDFYDRLKSISKGYATMNYDLKWYEESPMIKLDIFINNEIIESFSQIVHKDKAYFIWRSITQKLKKLIPRHMFAVPIQAGIGNKIIARETISAMKKDVIAKCYGGDVSRKRKLLQKQKEGKKKMKALWSVKVPGDIFIKMISKE